MRLITEFYTNLLNDIYVGKESLILETNEQIVQRLLLDVTKTAAWNSNLSLDESTSGHICWWRNVVRGNRYTYYEFTEYNQVALDQGVQIASAHSMTFGVLSGSNTSGGSYDLSTAFMVDMGSDDLEVSQVRSHLLDLTNPVERERIESYPLYGIMNRPLPERWEELLTVIYESSLTESL